MAFRSYLCRWLFYEPHQFRPPILKPGAARPGDVVGRYLAALEAGDTEAVVSTFAPDGYYREPAGTPSAHRGTDELRSFFSLCFSAGGVRCALEYNLVRWGRHDLPPQAGIAVFDRSPDGLLAAVRVYDDVAAPVSRS